jgi:hypothetical protein
MDIEEKLKKRNSYLKFVVLRELNISKYVLIPFLTMLY